MNITHKWKRLLAVGCSHGDMADPNALEAVLEFKRRFKPDFTAHLGDAFDTAAFRSGAAGTNDEAREISPDAMSGLDFLEKLRPTVFCVGNHEQRLYMLRNSPKAIVSQLAGDFVSIIEKTLKKAGCQHIVPYNILNGYHEHAGYKYLHGYIYNEMACRDNAEIFGNSVSAHTHQTGMAKGRRLDNPTNYSVGTLARIANMDYALQRRKTLAWSGGLVWGEYHDNTSVIWLHQQPRDEPKWRLPV